MKPQIFSPRVGYKVNQGTITNVTELNKGSIAITITPNSILPKYKFKVKIKEGKWKKLLDGRGDFFAILYTKEKIVFQSRMYANKKVLLKMINKILPGVEIVDKTK